MKFARVGGAFFAFLLVTPTAIADVRKPVYTLEAVAPAGYEPPAPTSEPIPFGPCALPVPPGAIPEDGGSGDEDCFNFNDVNSGCNLPNPPPFLLLQPGQVVVGHAFSGHFTYYLHTPDTFPGSEIGEYRHDPPRGPAGMSIALPVSGMDFTTDPNSPFFIQTRDAISAPNDFISAFPADVATGLPFTPTLISTKVELIDTSKTVFSNDSLPTQLDLNAFDLHRILISLFDPSLDTADIEGDITMLTRTVSPVPFSGQQVALAPAERDAEVDRRLELPIHRLCRRRRGARRPVGPTHAPHATHAAQAASLGAGGTG